MEAFLKWLFSFPRAGVISKPEPWGILHIIVLIITIGTIIGLTFLFKNKSPKAKFKLIFILAMNILVWEVVRRSVNVAKMEYIKPDGTFDVAWLISVILPGPWCAISCWGIVCSVFIKKKFFYNFIAITGLMNCIVFFSYPQAGFRTYIQFENLYSIVSHVLLTVSSTLLITLKFTDFRYKRENNTALGELICLACVFIYAGIQNLTGMDKDPLFLFTGNFVMELFKLPYIVYCISYLALLGVWCNAFYLIPILRNKYRQKHITEI